jgi:hypothetical protein
MGIAFRCGPLQIEVVNRETHPEASFIGAVLNSTPKFATVTKFFECYFLMHQLQSANPFFRFGIIIAMQSLH